MYSIFEELNKIDDSEPLQEESVAYSYKPTPEGISSDISHDILKILHNKFPHVQQVYTEEVDNMFKNLSAAVNVLFAEEQQAIEKEQGAKGLQSNEDQTPMTPEEESELTSMLQRKIHVNKQGISTSEKTSDKLRKALRDI